MTPEQAIEYFTDIIASYGAPASKTRYIEAAKAALNALKRDVKRHTINKASEVVSNETSVFGQCPFCGIEVSSDFNYCPNCGQAFEWSGDNE